MTAITYFGEMLVASLLAIVLLAISPLETTYAGALFAGGAVAWTLSEYVVHRFVLHSLAPTQHALYHANPDEPVLTVFWKIWACFALVYSIAGGVFLAGSLIAYGWYLFVHHCAHHRPSNLPLPQASRSTTRQPGRTKSRRGPNRKTRDRSPAPTS
ncbi:hypothetical protein [uncultured Bradyrhizobium sp.]|uniref:hypothetical protein n=1 Tax=Bradyrhizobium sp. TaxID=376 RepID=UPI00260FDEF6|nr:hypothetical protein [uncultured Bradyrhizobium sp.]